MWTRPAHCITRMCCHQPPALCPTFRGAAQHHVPTMLSPAAVQSTCQQGCSGKPSCPNHSPQSPRAPHSVCDCCCIAGMVCSTHGAKTAVNPTCQVRSLLHQMVQSIQTATGTEWHASSARHPAQQLLRANTHHITLSQHTPAARTPAQAAGLWPTKSDVSVDTAHNKPRGHSSKGNTCMAPEATAATPNTPQFTTHAAPIHYKHTIMVLPVCICSPLAHSAGAPPPACSLLMTAGSRQQALAGKGGHATAAMQCCGFRAQAEH